MYASNNLHAVLKSRFGYDSFREHQEEIIGNVLAGRDSLVLMPTGGGKSLCYQLPALVFRGVTLVVSPLIALMKDQVDALNHRGIAARYINSSLSAFEIERVRSQLLAGQVRILYVAPERLALPAFRRFLSGLNLSLIAIDEAHCISEWGPRVPPRIWQSATTAKRLPLGASHCPDRHRYGARPAGHRRPAETAGRTGIPVQLQPSQPHLLGAGQRQDLGAADLYARRQTRAVDHRPTASRGRRRRTWPVSSMAVACRPGPITPGWTPTPAVATRRTSSETGCPSSWRLSPLAWA